MKLGWIEMVSKRQNRIFNIIIYASFATHLSCFQINVVTLLWLYCGGNNASNECDVSWMCCWKYVRAVPLMAILLLSCTIKMGPKGWPTMRCSTWGRHIDQGCMLDLWQLTTHSSYLLTHIL